jgi:hypothetical protein
MLRVDDETLAPATDGIPVKAIKLFHTPPASVHMPEAIFVAVLLFVVGARRSI